MIHVTCDSCGKSIEGQEHIVVTIDARPARSGWELTADDLSQDSLEEMSQWLDSNASENDAAGINSAPLKLDLCPRCRDRFLGDPLQNKFVPLDFSEN